MSKFLTLNKAGHCPDTLRLGPGRAESWDYGSDEASDLVIANRTVLLDASRSVGNLVIDQGGKLIFKDFGSSAIAPLLLRAKSIKVTNGGELWIGSRSCRYQGMADVVLYGNRNDVTFNVRTGW